MERLQPMVEQEGQQVQPPTSSVASTLSLAQRRAFMCLSLEERRQLLAQQAEEMCKHYQQNTEWQELESGDIIDC